MLILQLQLGLLAKIWSNVLKMYNVLMNERTLWKEIISDEFLFLSDDKRNFTLSFQQQKNYPVDLYLLFDLTSSIQIQGDEEKLVNLGEELRKLIDKITCHWSVTKCTRNIFRMHTDLLINNFFIFFYKFLFWSNHTNKSLLYFACSNYCSIDDFHTLSFTKFTTNF